MHSRVWLLSNERFCFKQEQEVRDWIEAVLEEPLPAGDYEEVCVPFHFIKVDICLCIDFSYYFVRSLKMELSSVA